MSKLPLSPSPSRVGLPVFDHPVTRRDEALAFVADEVRRSGGTCLRGWYRPTGKNELVKACYERHGFVLTDEMSDGSPHWALDVTATPIAALPSSRRS